MKHVAVIGAGAAGLAALRSLSKFKDTLKFVAFERSDRVGGTWIHNDPFKPTSMYDNLRTNLPKEAMAFPDHPFSSDIQHSFVGHTEVLEYLQSFAEEYNLQQYIQFRHKVEKVDPIALSSAGTTTGWNVTVRNERTDELTTQQFDAVIVCNGHYTDPYIPELEGQDTFTGEILHCHNYRSPSTYKGKTVLVLGAGPSGKDIAADLTKGAGKIYLSHNNENVAYALPNLVEEVPGVCKIVGDNIELNDGRIVQADTILLATGYKYSFPFLSKRCSPDIRNEHIRHIYRFMVDINHPSLYYIGLNKDGLSFPQYHLQTEYAAACIVGVAKQPSKEEMIRDYEQMYEKLVTEMNRSEKDFHNVDDHQWEYHVQLSSEGRVKNLNRGVETLYWHIVDLREYSFTKYKTGVYRLTEDSTDYVALYEPDEDSGDLQDDGKIMLQC